MTFLPAPDSHGYIFKRIDLPGQPLINALAENVVETTRGTVLEENGARVSTVEHVLASFVGMGIDNVLVDVDGPEAPILDGSARDFAEAIDKIGAVDQSTDRKYFILKEKVEYYDEERGIHIIAYPDKIQSINVLIDYNSLVLGNQYASLEELQNFKEEIAPCRTFVFLRELEYLAKNNLIKGGDVDNAIVIAEGMMVRMQAVMGAAQAAGESVGKTIWALLGGTVIGILAFSAIGLSPDSTGEFANSLF